MDMTSALEAADVRLSVAVQDGGEGDDRDLDPDYRPEGEEHQVALSDQPAGYIPILNIDPVGSSVVRRPTVVERLLAYEPLAGVMPQFVRDWAGVGGANASEQQESENGGSWVYVDDSGKDQGPFTTTRMRNWLRKGYLTNSRFVRRIGDPPTMNKPLGQWLELDTAGVKEKAKRGWKLASKMVTESPPIIICQVTVFSGQLPPACVRGGARGRWRDPSPVPFRVCITLFCCAARYRLRLLIAVYLRVLQERSFKTLGRHRSSGVPIMHAGSGPAVCLR